MNENGPKGDIRILLIDDEPNLLEMSQELLAEVGKFDVTAVSSAPLGLKALAEAKYDAVVSDFDMPGMDGIALLQTLRSGGSNIPFILFTGKGREEIVIQALNSGADFYLQKGGDVRSTFTELSHKVRTAVARRRSEAAQRESEYRYRGLVEKSPDMIWEIDSNGIFTYVSPQVKRLLGFSPEEALGRSIFDFVEREEIPRVHEVLRASVLGDRKHEIMEVKARSKTGDRCVIEIRSLPTMTPDGSLGGFMGLARNVTEKRRIEDMLLHSNQLMSYIIEHARSAIAVHDRELRYIYVSENYLEQYGVKDRNVIGKHHYDVFPDLPQKWRDVHQRALAGEVMSADDDPYYREDGSVEWTSWECRPWYESDGKIGGIIVYTEVITGRKRIEEDLRANQAKLAEAMKLAKLASWEYDPRRDELKLNDGFYSLFGTSVERVGSYVISSEEYVTKFVHPDDADLVRSKFKETTAGMGPDKCGYLEHRIIRGDGEVRNIMVRYNVQVGSGKNVKVYGANQDIEERVRFNNALKQANKHLGTLSHITSHDVQNKILVVLGNLDLVRQRTKDRNLERHLATIESAVRDIESQVRFMKTYVDIGQGAQSWQGLSSLVPKDVPEGVLLNSDVGNYEVYADPMLGKVFANLLDNSVRHGGHVENVMMRTEVSGDDLHIIYEDDGVGIDEKDRAKLFEPGAGHHTGFGLFLAREILNITGLSIVENGTEGNGVRFTIDVPVGKWRHLK